MLWKIHWLVADNFDEEVLKPSVEASVHVTQNIRFNQLWIIASRNNSNADERRQQWTSFQHDFVRESVVDEKSEEVAQHLRQREERHESQRVEEDGPSCAVLGPRVDGDEVILGHFNCA